MARFGISRRSLLFASAAAGAAASGLVTPTLAKAPVAGVETPLWYRFMLGAFECAVVSDGVLQLGDPAAPFPDAPKAELLAMLESRFLPTDQWNADENVLVVNTGERLVIFDSGIGGTPGGAGRLIRNLGAAGIRPDQVDAVVLSHAHPDHVGGLHNERAEASFPNATIHMAESDFAFWTDETRASGTNASALEQAFAAGARKILIPLHDRISFFKEGEEFLPGIVAMSAPGHTVGHTIFAVSSGGKTLFNCADLAHHPLLMLEYPLWKFAVDTDADAAVKSRLKYLAMIADEKATFMAYHFPFPGIGHAAHHGNGFSFVASPLLPAL